jgi:hypothetical protein
MTGHDVISQSQARVAEYRKKTAALRAYTKDLRAARRSFERGVANIKRDSIGRFA